MPSIPRVLTAAALLLLSAACWLSLRLSARLAHRLEAGGRDSEAKAVSSERTLHSILSIASDAIIEIAADDRIVLANDAATKMFRPDRVLLGAHAGTLLAPETWAELQRVEGSAVGMSGHGRRGGGVIFPVECALARFLDASGHPVRVLIVTDVSARQRHEDWLLEARGESHRMNDAFERALAREAERRQAAIARELHDAVGSSLAGISLLLGTAYSYTREPEASALISKSQELVMLTSQQVRQIARGIMPAGQERGGLLPALEQFASELADLPGRTCSVRSRGDFSHVSAEVGGHLFRIVQEATNNALRHGHAMRIRITLAQAGPWYRLTIWDNGVGFEPEKMVGAEPGIGMKSMRARAEAIGGRFSVVNSPGHPLKVQVTWLCTPG